MPRKYVLRIGFLAALLMLVSFQNCSSETKYSAVHPAADGTVSAAGGGEGYGGMVYLSLEICPNGQPKSEIDVTPTKHAYLMRAACQNLAQVKPISVVFDPNGMNLTYAGSTYVLSSQPSLVAPSPLQFSASEMAVLPANGVASDYFPGYYVLLNNFTLLNPVIIADARIHTIAISAIADVSNGTGAIMEVGVDGIVVGSVMVMNDTQAATFNFSTYISPGVHELSIAFTNDVYIDNLHDINLMVGTISIQ